MNNNDMIFIALALPFIVMLTVTNVFAEDYDPNAPIKVSEISTWLDENDERQQKVLHYLKINGQLFPADENWNIIEKQDITKKKNDKEKNSVIFNTIDLKPKPIQKEKYVLSVDMIHRGLVHITLVNASNNTWKTDDGFIYQMNNFESFNLINSDAVYKINRIDSGEPKNREHSEFKKIVNYEQQRAKYVWNGDEIISIPEPSFTYIYPSEDSRTKFMREHNMLWIRK